MHRQKREEHPLIRRRLKGGDRGWGKGRAAKERLGRGEHPLKWRGEERKRGKGWKHEAVGETGRKPRRKLDEETRKTKFAKTEIVGAGKTQLEIGERARETAIGQTQIFYREKTTIGQTKIEGGKVGEEGRKAAVRETSSCTTKTETRTRELEGVGCGEGASLVGKEALAEAKKKPVECVGSNAWREDG